jgi:uncharacterized protein
MTRLASTACIPSVDECLEIMTHHGMMSNIRRHSLMVARVAVILGNGLNRRECRLSIPLIIAGALLHDIAKTRSLLEGGDHVKMGRKMVLELGYPQVAWIVGTHVDSGQEIVDRINESAVVNYSDKRVRHDRVVSLKERLRDLVARYGGTLETRCRLRDMTRNIGRLEKEIFSQIPLSPREMESMIQDLPPCSLFEEAILGFLRKMD